MVSRSPAFVRRVALLAALGVTGATAGVLWPSIRAADLRARQLALSTDLSALQFAVEEYQRDHEGRLPGSDGVLVRAELLVQQLTMPTSPDGSIHEGGGCGPYLRAGVPPNPLDGIDEVRVVTVGSVPAADGSGGWIFHPPSGRFHANTRTDAR